jgi:Icc-related predicted phosphoesterase
VEGLRIWGSAITPYFCNWAWNRYRGAEIKRHWDKIPNDIDVLVTHGPPHKILDTILRTDPVMGNNVGCQDLFNKILEIPTLKHHFFGHIHGGYGHENFNGVDYWNCAVCDESYVPTNLPIVVDI